MPSPAPTATHATTAQLSRVGQCIARQRKALGVSAVDTAASAGMSRVTLHRIERGEASVTMGAYLNAASALGLVVEMQAQRPVTPRSPEKAT